MCLQSEWFGEGLTSPPGVTPLSSCGHTPGISVHYNLTIIKSVLPIHSRHYYYCTQSLQYFEVNTKIVSASQSQ